MLPSRRHSRHVEIDVSVFDFRQNDVLQARNPFSQSRPDVVTGKLVPDTLKNQFGGSIGGLEFEVLLEALESKGMVRTLAEPNLTALSGQEAKFLAGGEYPVPVSQTNDTVTVEYKPFGVELNFTFAIKVFYNSALDFKLFFLRENG